MNEGLVALGIAAIGFIAWLSRLESKTSTNSRDLDRIDRRQSLTEEKFLQFDNRVMHELSEIKQMVANINGRLDIDQGR